MTRGKWARIIAPSLPCMLLSSPQFLCGYPILNQEKEKEKRERERKEIVGNRRGAGSQVKMTSICTLGLESCSDCMFANVARRQ